MKIDDFVGNSSAFDPSLDPTKLTFADVFRHYLSLKEAQSSSQWSLSELLNTTIDDLLSICTARCIVTVSKRQLVT